MFSQACVTHSVQGVGVPQHATAADPGFPQGGGRQLLGGGGGSPTYDFAKFSRKLHEIERIRAPRGARAPCAPPKSATVPVSFPAAVLVTFQCTVNKPLHLFQ